MTNTFDPPIRHAGDVIDGVERRLRHLSDQRPFRFRATRSEDALRYIAQLGRLEGCLLTDVLAAERAMGVLLPRVLVRYFTRLGTARAGLFVGSDVAVPRNLVNFKVAADRIAARGGQEPLPRSAVVLLIHQGYSAVFIHGAPQGVSRPMDAPVFNLVEGEAPRQIAPSLEAWFDKELSLMEEVNGMQRAQGGYFVTLRDGRVTETHPALNARPRPLDTED